MARPDSPSPFILLTGPTAVGKTALSLALAERLEAEIISADSRQIYRELSIGTAKPSADELAMAPHHFINERSLNEPFSAGAFARAAAERIDGIVRRGKVPLVVGGSTLYLHALQFGIADIPAIDPSVRTDIEARLQQEGAEALYQELRSIDPTYAQTLDPTKSQRLVRGLEVYHGTGRTLSDYHKTQAPPPFSFKTIVLQRAREELYQRINQRVDIMLGEGLVEETKSVLAAGFSPSLNPLRTIGYQEVIAFLNGAYDYAEMVRLIKRNTRRYAKRQLTWFRRFSDFHWVSSFDIEDLPIEYK